MGAVQVQWSLDQAYNATLGTFRGLLEAATTDNVQVLALLACEQFGNTLAIDRQTIHKIERTVVPTPQAAVLKFVKSSIGYAANDSVSRFGQSLAGLQFLALAAALVTSMDHFESGMAIHEMLTSTVKDEKTLLPTEEHVRNLIRSIEPRCQRYGIADDIAGWKMFLTKFDNGRLRVNGEMDHYPKRDGVKGLVDAFRQLRRIGDEDIFKVTIRTTNCAPWTIAFAKWCLGYPPSIILDDGSPIIEQTNADVAVIISQQRDHGLFRVTIHSSIHGPSDIVNSRLGKRVCGMIGVATYGDLLLHHYGFDKGNAQRAFQQAMPCALYQVIQQLVLSDRKNHRQTILTEFPIDLPGTLHVDEPLDDEIAQGLRLSPFPANRTISETCYMLFKGIFKPFDLRSPGDGLRTSDLPLVDLHLRGLKSECDCAKCRPASGSVLKCKADVFFENFSIIIADILALSLFDFLDDLKVWDVLIRAYRNCNHGFVQAIHLTLVHGTMGRCSLMSVLNWVLQLVGHDIKRLDGKPWVLSSCKGQTIWPRLYESLAYEKEGYLGLSWAPGLIRHKNSVYDRAMGPVVTQRGDDPVTGKCQENVVRPLNLCPGLGLQWTVSPTEEGLEVSIGIKDELKRYSSVVSCPTSILTSLSTAILIEDCSHGSTAPLRCPDHFSVFTGPMKIMKSTDDETLHPGTSFRFQAQSTGSDTQWTTVPSAVQVTPQKNDSQANKGAQELSLVAVDGSDELRFFALSNRSRGVTVALRKEACLQCCLDSCRRTGYTVIIL